MSSSEAQAQIAIHSLLQAVLIDWDLAEAKAHKGAGVIADVRARAARLPIFLLAASGAFNDMSAEVLSEGNDYLWLFEDTPDFIGGRPCATPSRTARHRTTRCGKSCCAPSSDLAAGCEDAHPPLSDGSTPLTTPIGAPHPTARNTPSGQTLSR